MLCLNDRMVIIILCDLGPNTPEELQLRSNIAGKHLVKQFICYERLTTYVTTPAELGSVQKLYSEGRKRNKNLTLDDVQSFLKGDRTHTLRNTTRKKFHRRNILAPKPWVVVSCDLGDFSALQKHKRGVKYIMFCLDVFSRYLQVVPLTSKSTERTENHSRV